MSASISILDKIKKGGYEASIITTFNAYLPFYEDVLLRKLISKGVRHNIVMMDASQCTSSISTHPPRLAGRQYSLIPIRAKKAFHPKIILLLGKNNGALFVGSHNLTLSGFGYNRELTNLVAYKKNETTEFLALFQEVWDQILGWVSSQSPMLPDHLVKVIKKTEGFAPWIRDEASALENYRIMGSNPAALSLWNQLKAFTIGDVRRVIVSGAFFDSELGFIKQIYDDLHPEELFVGIDPATVQFPNVKKPDIIKFRDCASLGPENKGAESKGYLHAKTMLIETAIGETILAVGSANPSAPAWLGEGISENIEMMLVKKGVAAEQAARDLGIMDIPDMPELGTHQWEIVTDNWELKKESGGEVSATGVAVEQDGNVVFVVPAEDIQDEVDCDILGVEGVVLTSCKARREKGEYVLFLQPDIVSGANLIKIDMPGKSLIFLIQHQQQIEENSRTGSQRRFREALASLSSGTPDIETLINCVDKIIFAKAADTKKIPDKINIKSENANSTDAADWKTVAPLSIDLSETKKTKKKYRLRQSDDLGYLLDVLIYHLRLQEEVLEAEAEARDAKGRNEEEQIGAEDDENHPGKETLEETTADDILALCHKKIRTLITRMIGQMNALHDGKNTLDDVVVRLTGVLAVLRQLRNCDGKVFWVRQGQTAFPLDERTRLFNGICQHLFEGNNSILYPSDEHKKILEADEFARLKGLILWLAWDCDTAERENEKVFNESPEKIKENLWKKALLVALIQLIKNDEVVVAEALQSIGPLCSSDMDWLNKLFAADKRLEKWIGSPGDLNDGSRAVTGDIAIHKNSHYSGVKLILSHNNGFVELACFAKNKNHLSYSNKFLRVGSFAV